MDKMYHNKLIRDGIPEKIKQKGEQFEVRKLVDHEEFKQELLKKVTEEAGELSRTQSREDFLKEYADLMVVLTTLEKELELSEAEIKLAIEENIKQKGKFDHRLYLRWSEDVNYKCK